MAGVLKLSGCTPGIVRQAIIIDALFCKWDIAFFIKALPTNPFSTLTNTLEFLSVICISFKNLLDRLDSLRPERSVVGRNGITSLEDFGAERVLDTFPPSRIAITSPSGCAMGMAGHMV